MGHIIQGPTAMHSMIILIVTITIFTIIVFLFLIIVIASILTIVVKIVIVILSYNYTLVMATGSRYESRNGPSQGWFALATAKGIRVPHQGAHAPTWPLLAKCQVPFSKIMAIHGANAPRTQEGPSHHRNTHAKSKTS